MLRPHHREDAKLGHRRLAAHDFQHQFIFVRGQAMFGDNVRGNLLGSTHDSASTMPWNSAKPSVEPCSLSMAFSGCGIMPSTFFVRLKMPAILRSEPLGLCSVEIEPSGAQ